MKEKKGDAVSQKFPDKTNLQVPNYLANHGPNHCIIQPFVREKLSSDFPIVVIFICTLTVIKSNPTASSVSLS